MRLGSLSMEPDYYSIYNLAERFEVIPYFAKFRIGLAKHYSPKKYAFLWGEELPQKECIRT